MGRGGEEKGGKKKMFFPIIFWRVLFQPRKKAWVTFGRDKDRTT